MLHPTQIQHAPPARAGHPTGGSMPEKDDKGNPLTTEYGLCKYVLTQEVSVQELPETAAVG